MTIAIITIGVIVAIFIVAEVVLHLVARRERTRVDNLPPAEQRKYQEQMYKQQQLT